MVGTQNACRLEGLQSNLFHKVHKGSGILATEQKRYQDKRKRWRAVRQGKEVATVWPMGFLADLAERLEAKIHSLLPWPVSRVLYCSCLFLD